MKNVANEDGKLIFDMKSVEEEKKRNLLMILLCHCMMNKVRIGVVRLNPRAHPDVP